jgi:MtrB/PioB family decaheme-associated outer membrane protein
MNVVNLMETRSILLTLAVASVLSAAGAAAAEQAAAPDTSEWTCSKCPFDRGYHAETELGGAYVDDDSAKFGDYTGLDEKGAYVIASAEGRASKESGYVLSYELTDLGLDSREVRLGGGKQGHYEFELFYDAIPHSLWDTTATPFSGNGSSHLTLPAGWVDAGSPAGMTALDASLHDVDVGFDRDRYGAAGSYWFGGNLLLDVDYRRDERSGTRTAYGSFGSVSTQLLQPVDDATDRLSASLRYQGRNWFAQAGFAASIYDTKAAYLHWDNPFVPMLPGANEGQMALAPDNTYNELSASAGWFGLPGRTTVTLSLATGKGEQDTGFLPYTVNPQLVTDALPANDLNGEVSVTRADLTLTSQPINRLRLRGVVAYDERDNDTKRLVYTSVVHTDLFKVLDDRTNPAYGFERFRVYGSADFDIYKDLAIGGGGEYRTLDRTGTSQEVKSETMVDGWGQVQYRPSGYLGFVLKGGAQERDPDKYDASAAGSGQNPLLRKYNMAYLYRSYGEALVNVAVGDLPVTLGASVFYGDDTYDFSTIGTTAGLDRRYGVDVNWAVSDKLSLYLGTGEEKIEAKSQGSQSYSQPDWRWVSNDEFSSWSGGLRTQPTAKLSFDIDYSYSKGNSRMELVGVAGGKFPNNTSELSALRVDGAYALTERLDLALTWRYESYNSTDWALQGIEPATLPTVLSLGADPYDYDVNYVGLSVRYSFRSPEPEAEE